MAAYLRQGGQVSLILSEAEAKALLALAEKAESHGLSLENVSAVKAADRAMQALAASTNLSARIAGYFPA